MRVDQEEKYCFNDILLVPECSSLQSRNDPDISTSIGNIELSTPIISSPMDSITEHKMVDAMCKIGGLGILTRYIHLDEKEEIEKQIHEIELLKKLGVEHIGCAIGIKNSLNKTKRLVDSGCNVICIDVAHCDHRLAYAAISSVLSDREKNNCNYNVIAGNVCTPLAATNLAAIGVDAIKVGVGPGAVCTTRKVTGFGVPQLSAISDCHNAICGKYPDVSIIADGGIRNSGDMVKSLWAGADACMVGYMLAGTDCCPDIEGKKRYRGMSSRNVSRREDIAPEGIDIAVKYKGQTIDVLQELALGIRSGLAMGGCRTIGELREKVRAVKISSASRQESQTLCQ